MLFRALAILASMSAAEVAELGVHVEAAPGRGQSNFVTIADKNGDGEISALEFSEALNACPECQSTNNMLISEIKNRHGVTEGESNKGAMSTTVAEGVPRSRGRLSKCPKKWQHGGNQGLATSALEIHSSSSSREGNKQEEQSVSQPKPLAANDLFSLLDADGNGGIGRGEIFDLAAGCVSCSKLLDKMAEDMKTSHKTSLAPGKGQKAIKKCRAGNAQQDLFADAKSHATGQEDAMKHLEVGDTAYKVPAEITTASPGLEKMILQVGVGNATADLVAEHALLKSKHAQDSLLQSVSMSGYLRNPFKRQVGGADDDEWEGGTIQRAAQLCEAEVACVCQSHVCPLFCALKHEGDEECLEKCKMIDIKTNEPMNAESDAEKWKDGYLEGRAQAAEGIKFEGQEKGFKSEFCGRFKVPEPGSEDEDGQPGWAGDGKELKATLFDMGIACIAQMRDPDNKRSGRRARDWTLMESPSWRKLKEDSDFKKACHDPDTQSSKVGLPHYNGVEKCSMPGFEEWKEACPNGETRDIPCKDVACKEYPPCAEKCTGGAEVAEGVPINFPSGGDDDCADSGGKVAEAVVQECRGITGIEVGEATVMLNGNLDIGDWEAVRDPNGCPLCCLGKTWKVDGEEGQCGGDTSDPPYKFCKGNCESQEDGSVEEVQCMQECSDAADAMAKKGGDVGGLQESREKAIAARKSLEDHHLMSMYDDFSS